MQRLISDNGVIRIEARTIAADQADDITYAAQVLAATRDAKADMVRQDGERGYWLSKCLHAAEAGGLIGLYVNGGQPCGAAVIERSVVQPGTALLLAASSMWDRGTTEPQLRRVAIDEAAAQGLRLFERSHERRPVQPDEMVIDADGQWLGGAAEIVRTVETPIA